MYFSDFFVITLYYTKFWPKLQPESATNLQSRLRFLV